MRILFLFFFFSRLAMKVHALKSVFVEYLFVISPPLLLLSLNEISIFFSCHHFPPLSPLAPHTVSSRQVTWPRLSAFFCFTAGGAVIKACQWETWVALSHALCLPSVNSPQPLAPSPLPAPNPPALCPLFLFLISLPFFATFSLPLCFFQRCNNEEQQQELHTHAHTHASACACTRLHEIYVNTAG